MLDKNFLDLFDIPIYRIDETKHTADVASDETAFLSDCTKYDSLLDDATQRKRKETLRNAYYSRYWSAWKYNEIIGWLNVRTEQTAVVIDLWQMDKHRFVRRGRVRKTFSGRYQCWMRTIVIDCDYTMSSLAIYEELLQSIRSVAAGKPYKGHYFDLDAFQNVGASLDWRTFLDSQPGLHKQPTTASSSALPW